MTNARQAMNQGDYALANSLFGQVVQMERDQGRDNAEAIAYFGWTLALLSVGDPDAEAATARLDAAQLALAQAIDMEPDYADPYCFQAIIEFQFREDAAAALPFAEQCQANDPPSEVADLIGAFVDDIRAAARRGLSPSDRTLRSAGGGQTVAETTRSSLRRRIHTLALRQSGSVLSCIPRRTRAWTVAGITSPWLHNTAPWSTSARRSSTPSNGCILEQAVVGPHGSMPTVAASGSSVCMQRTYGLDTSRPTPFFANRLPSAWACFQPALLNGRSRSSPVHMRRSPALACRTR